MKKRCNPLSIVHWVGMLPAALLTAFMWVNATQAVEEIPEYRTRRQEGCHTTGIYPATRRIQNRMVTSGYSVDVCENTTTIFRAPKVVLRPGFRARYGSKFRAGVLKLDVHFTVMEPDAAALSTTEDFQSVIDTVKCTSNFRTPARKFEPYRALNPGLSTTLGARNMVVVFSHTSTL